MVMSFSLSQLIAYLVTGTMALAGALGVDTAVLHDIKQVVVIEPLERMEVEGEHVSLLEVIATAVNNLKKAVDAGPAVANVASSTIRTGSSTVATSGNLGESIVNIYCLQKGDGYKRITSGTGFLIDEQGVILTNAHVGQFLLLESLPDRYDIDCTVRVGQTSEAAYDAELLYISPSWLLENVDLIKDLKPKGTGENDFALLYITEAVNGHSKPDSFTYLQPATSPLLTSVKGDTVILVGYPSTGIASGTRMVATTTITDLYTFDSGKADIFSVEATPLGYHGVSGGPVIDHLGRAIGVITTKDPNTTVLNAITLAHIDRSIKQETGSDLMTILSGDLSYRVKLFNATIAPILSEILTRELQ